MPQQHEQAKSDGAIFITNLKEKFRRFRFKLRYKRLGVKLPMLRKGMMYCFLDVKVPSGDVHRLVVECNTDVCPRTCENFRVLCTGERGFGYKGKVFHRIQPQFIVQAGKVGQSIFGKPGYFPDESFELKHDSRFDVSMANLGEPNTNADQFFITCCPHNASGALDDKYVKFGTIAQGKWVIAEIESTFNSDHLVEIVDCGVLDKKDVVFDGEVDKTGKPVAAATDKTDTAESDAQEAGALNVEVTVEGEEPKEPNVDAVIPDEEPKEPSVDAVIPDEETKESDVKDTTVDAGAKDSAADSEDVKATDQAADSGVQQSDSAAPQADTPAQHSAPANDTSNASDVAVE